MWVHNLQQLCTLTQPEEDLEAVNPWNRAPYPQSEQRPVVPTQNVLNKVQDPSDCSWAGFSLEWRGGLPVKLKLFQRRLRWHAGWRSSTVNAGRVEVKCDSKLTKGWPCSRLSQSVLAGDPVLRKQLILGSCGEGQETQTVQKPPTKEDGRGGSVKLQDYDERLFEPVQDAWEAIQRGLLVLWPMQRPRIGNQEDGALQDTSCSNSSTKSLQKRQWPVLRLREK